MNEKERATRHTVYVPPTAYWMCVRPFGVLR